MIKRLNIALTEEQHLTLLDKKEQLRKQLKKTKLSWENYFLELSKKQ
jgi:hypothetical protein